MSELGDLVKSVGLGCAVDMAAISPCIPHSTGMSPPCMISLHHCPAPGAQGGCSCTPALPWSSRTHCWAVPRHPIHRTMKVMPAGASQVLLVLLLCWVAPSRQEPAPVRLRLGGPRGPAGEGRLEVLYQGRWGTVCDDGFDFHAATVACRQLGYTAAITWTHSATYGQGEGRGQVGNGGQGILTWAVCFPSAVGASPQGCGCRQLAGCTGWGL